MIIDTTDTTARSPEEPASGSHRVIRRLYHIICPGCGKAFVTYRSGCTLACTECGTLIPLSKASTRKICAECGCGGCSVLRTNVTAPTVAVRCLVCHEELTATWSDYRHRYESELTAQRQADLLASATRRRPENRAMVQLALMVLHDKFGFGPERAARFAAHLWPLIEEYRSHEISLEDITAALEADGIKVED